MHLFRPVLELLLLFGFGLVLPSAADPAPGAGSPEAVVRALYQTCIDHSAGFDAAGVKLAKPYLSPDLYAKILKKLNQPTPPGDAPDIDGDIFLDAQDLPTSFSIGQTTDLRDFHITDVGLVTVPVILKWSDEKRVYAVSLKQIDGIWKVTDVNYGKDGTLLDLLK